MSWKILGCLLCILQTCANKNVNLQTYSASSGSSLISCRSFPCRWKPFCALAFSPIDLKLGLAAWIRYVLTCLKVLCHPKRESSCFSAGKRLFNYPLTLLWKQLSGEESRRSWCLCESGLEFHLCACLSDMFMLTVESADLINFLCMCSVCQNW